MAGCVKSRNGRNCRLNNWAIFCPLPSALSIIKIG
jgi:hypothetical protein